MKLSRVKLLGFDFIEKLVTISKAGYLAQYSMCYRDCVTSR